MYSGAINLLQIRYAVILALFCPCFLRLVLANSLFSLGDINLMFPPQSPHDFSALSRLTVRLYYLARPTKTAMLRRLQSARIFVIRAFSGCYAILTSFKEGETAVYGYNPALF